GIERLRKRGGPCRRAGHAERLRRGLVAVPIVVPVACAAVADFLSDEWIAELALACRTARVGEGSDAGRLVIEPLVHGVPARGDVRYRIAFDADECAVSPEPDAGEPADVRLETDYVTAVAL